MLSAVAFGGNAIALYVAADMDGALWQGALEVFAVNLLVSGGAAVSAASLAVDLIFDRRESNRRAWCVLFAALVAGIWAVWRLVYSILFIASA